MAHELPGAEFWSLLRPHTGDLTAAEPTVRGFGSDFTGIVSGEKGPFFVKAMRNRDGGRRNSLVREREINPAVRPLAPALAWTAEDEHWIVLGFTVVPGRRSEFAPDSPDLVTVTRLLDEVGRVELPEFTRSWREERWDRFAASPEAAALFRGSGLVHGDINPGNVLIHGEGGWIVDWAWPTRGAGFIDPACLVVQLVASGHRPESAESWASQCAGWREAEREAIDAFAVATENMWRTLVSRRPDVAWLTAMLDAARSWARHRGVGSHGTE
ncbi:phosphotransferase [Streptomyces sp. JNUCC 64]